MTGNAPKDSVEELLKQPDDGRYIDPSVGALSGEGSHQQTKPQKAAPHGAEPSEVFSSVPSIWQGQQAEPTYYGKPAIKSPVWIWTIPAYFFVGGLAGAAMVLAAAAQLFGGKRMQHLAQRAYWVGAVGGSVSSALLVADLGRPTRFLNMLRVFRPTSPMSVGSWVLAAATPCSLGAALFYRSNALLARLGGTGAAVFGIPLAGYTGVLLGNTAVPVWQQARRSLPVLFMSSSMNSAAGILKLIPLSPGAYDIVHTFGVMGAVVELAASEAFEREVSRVERVGKPLREGAPSVLWKTAKVLTVASLLVSLAPGRSRRMRQTAGILAALGSLCLRFAVFHAGKASARDPRATFGQQRAGFGGFEVTKEPSITGPETKQVPKPVPAPKTREEIWSVPQLTP